MQSVKRHNKKLFLFVYWLPWALYIYNLIKVLQMTVTVKAPQWAIKAIVNDSWEGLNDYQINILSYLYDLYNLDFYSTHLENPNTLRVISKWG